MRRPFVDRRLSRKCHPPSPILHSVRCRGFMSFRAVEPGIRGLGFMSKIPFQTRRGKKVREGLARQALESNGAGRIRINCPLGGDGRR